MHVEETRKTLSKQDAYDILRLEPGANSYEIETRYTLLMKGFRGKTDPESLEKLEQVVAAYDLLMGRTVTPEPIDPRMQQVIWGKTRYEWQTFWHYHKLAFLIGAVVLVFIGSILYTILTHKDPDFQVVVVGQFRQGQHTLQALDDYLPQQCPSVETVEFQLLPLTFEEADESTQEEVMGGASDQLRSAYIMKMVALITVDTIELYVCDQNTFDQYAPQGAFLELDAFYGRLTDNPDPRLAALVPLRHALQEASDLDDWDDGSQETEPRLEPEADDRPRPIFGLDVTDLDLLKRLDIQGDKQILAIGRRADDPEQVMSFLESWILDQSPVPAGR